MALVQVWRSADRRWRIELDDRGVYRIVHDTLPVGQVRSVEALEAKLRDLGAPGLAELVED
jgi:hypothetical protein